MLNFISFMSGQFWYRDAMNSNQILSCFNFRGLMQGNCSQGANNGSDWCEVYIFNVPVITFGTEVDHSKIVPKKV